MSPRRLLLDPATVDGLLKLRKEAELDGAHGVAKRIKIVILNAWGFTSGDLASVLKVPHDRKSRSVSCAINSANWRACWRDNPGARRG